MSIIEREREREMERTGEIEIEGDTPLFNARIKRAQKAAMSGKWAAFKQIFEEDKKDLLEDFDLFGNTAIHVASRSKDPTLFREMLEMLPEEERWVALRKGNKDEDNTLLHEVVICDNVKMADVVFEFEKKVVMPSPPPEVEEEKKRALVEIKNRKGETPLFRAAKMGKLEMLNHIMLNHTAKDAHLRRHFRNNLHTILHASVIGQFFDVAVWIMMRMDENLALEKDKNGSTCLQVLSRMPDVFPSHYPRVAGFKKLIYKLLPEEGYKIDGIEFYEPKSDLESGQQDYAKPTTTVLSRINYAVWKHLAKVIKDIDRVLETKKQHKLAECLVGLLVKKDLSWQKSHNETKKVLVAKPYVPYNVAKRKKQMKLKEELQTKDDLKRRKKEKKMQEDDLEPRKEKQKQEKEKETQDDDYYYYNYTPLLLAASRGIVEIVDKILEEHPEAINHVSEDEQNILHMAVKHRQLEIYELIEKKAGFDSLASRVSNKNRTILHQVAIMDFYRGADLSGAAFQLQHELRWYKRVEEIIPNRLYLHCDEDNLTAGDVLDIEHDDMLRDAQEWIKQTAESCSVVAVLVATVVFTAAYTIPGGSEAGTPVFLRSPVFIFFTVMDIVALAFSLASVVMFLSILTSPFELWNFHKSLPGKLKIGFAFLFLSLMTTMLAFSATILLTIRLEWKNWTSTLVYSAAFFPVTIFGLIEFPLYKKLPSLFGDFFGELMKVLPISGVIRYFRTRAATRMFQSEA